MEVVVAKEDAHNSTMMRPLAAATVVDRLAAVESELCVSAAVVPLHVSMMLEVVARSDLLQL